MLQPSNSKELTMKWTKLAQEMGLPFGKIEQLRRSLNRDDSTLDHVMENVLLEWKSIKSNDATLAELLKIIQASGLN